MAGSGRGVRSFNTAKSREFMANFSVASMLGEGKILPFPFLYNKALVSYFWGRIFSSSYTGLVALRYLSSRRLGWLPSIKGVAAKKIMDFSSLATHKTT